MHSCTKCAIVIFGILTASLFSTSVFAQLSPSQAEKDSLALYDEIMLDRVTVVGKPAWMKEVPGAASYIEMKDIELQEYSDINRILRRVPGIYIQEEDGYGLRPNIGLRGTGTSRSSKVTLMEDGVLIAPAPYAAPAAYYTPTAGRMSSFEVRKGSSQIKYGPNTNGGAINYRSTPIPSDLSANIDLTLGETSMRKVHATVGNTHKNFGYMFETYQMANDGFKNLDGGGNTGFDTKDFLAKVMFRTNPQAKVFQKVEFKAGYYDEISNETYLGLTENDFDRTPYRRYAASQVDEMDADHKQFQIRHFAMFSDKLDLTTTAYYNEFNRNWYKLDNVNGVGISKLLANPQQHESSYNVITGTTSSDDALSLKNNNRAYYSQGIQTALNYHFNVGDLESQLEVGARYHQDEMDRYQWVNGYRMQEGVMVQTSQGEPGTESNRIESANALALYIQDEISFGNWIVTPGLRYEHIEMKRKNFGSNDPDRSGSNLAVNETTLDVLVPGVGINYAVSKKLNLFGGIHKGFTPPGPSADDQTDAEESINYELGSRYSTEVFNVELVAFFNDYSNLLGNDLAAGGGSGTTEQFNAGEINVKGVEFSLTHNLLAEKSDLDLPISISYTFTDTNFQNAFESDTWGTVEEGDELPYLPKHQLNGNIGIEKGGFTLNLDAYTTSAMRTVAGSGDIQDSESTDAYLRFDGSASYQINDMATVFANMRNITDVTYIVSRRPAGLRPGLPQTFMGGIKIDI